MSEITEQFLISVIIPTYNRANLIPRAIASVQEQSYQNWEIIVVDDASSDDTERVIQHINSDRLKYIRHQTNLGGSAARNTGIKHARGEYIAFLDSDDVWLPDKLKYQLAAVIQYDDRDNLVCYSQFQKSFQVFYQRSILPQRGKQENETVADYFWLSGGEMLTSTLLISRNIAMATLFKSDLAKHQDLDFMLRLEQQEAKFIFVTQVLAVWHNEPRSDSISKKANYQLSLDWIEQYKLQISERAFQGFLLKEIVPKMIREPESKAQATNLIFKAWREGIISLFYCLFLLIKLVILPKYQQQIKKFFNATSITHL